MRKKQDGVNALQKIEKYFKNREKALTTNKQHSK